MLKSRDPHLVLTEPDPDIRQKRENTHPGMAHWGGTGPDDKRCYQCLHWNIRKKPSDYQSNGMLRSRACAKFKQHTGGIGAAVPYWARSCKMFEENPNAPAPEKRDTASKAGSP